MGKLSRTADELWSRLVRSTTPGDCESCYRPPQLVTIQAAHGFSRRYRGTRWLPINGFRLCKGCHVGFTYNPLAWDDWLRVVWGLPVYEELRRKAQAVARFTREDMERIIADLRRELGES